jgi:hypothetical protein
VAVASWQAEIPVERVQQVVGLLPPMVVGELLAKVAATLARPADTPAIRTESPMAKAAEESEKTPSLPARTDRGELIGNGD